MSLPSALRSNMNAASNDVAALILHFRTPNRTLACLRALAREGIRQVVLVDNSEDRGVSFELMRSGVDGLRESGVNVAVISPAGNLGFARGVNVGLRCALEWIPRAILLINSDAQLEPGGLNALREALETSDVVVPWSRSRPGTPASPLTRIYQSATGLLVSSPRLRCVHFVSGCCLLLRASIIRLPFLDEAFFFYGEDVILGRDLHRRHARIFNCRDAVVLHAGSGSSSNGSMFYEYHINRWHLIIARKLASSKVQYVAYIACRCLTLPTRALVRSVRLRSVVPWHGLLAAFLDVLRGRVRHFTPPTP